MACAIIHMKLIRDTSNYAVTGLTRDYTLSCRWTGNMKINNTLRIACLEQVDINRSVISPSAR